MTLTRRLWPLALILGGAALFYALGAAFLSHAAHAAVVVASAGAPPPPEPLGWVEYLGIGLAALAGLETVIKVLLSGFTWLAPRTKTTADDTIRDDLKLAHDKIDALTELVRGVVPRSTAAGVIAIPPKDGAP